MTAPRFNLHQKLSLLFAAIGVGSLLAFSLVVYLVYQQLFVHFLPDNSALRELESRSATTRKYAVTSSESITRSVP